MTFIRTHLENAEGVFEIRFCHLAVAGSMSLSSLVG
jgi:hypothetical protein